MRAIGSKVLTAASLLFALSLLLRPDVSAAAALLGLRLCAKAVVPCLFPFLAVTSFWQFGSSPLLQRMVRPFHLPAAAAQCWLAGALGGYPAGAKAVVQCYGKDLLTKKQAEQALFFCCNAGPAFAVGVLGAGLLGDPSAGLVLYGIHLVCSLILGLLFRPASECSMDKGSPAKSAVSWTDAVVSAGQTALTICTYLVFFSLLTAHGLQLLPKSIEHSLLTAVLTGLLELTNGAAMLARLDLSAPRLFVLYSALLGWGGLCVHGQTMAMLSGSGLSAGTYWRGKLLHGILSGAMACLAAPVLWPAVPSHTTKGFCVFLLPAAGIACLMLAKNYAGNRAPNPL